MGDKHLLSCKEHYIDFRTAMLKLKRKETDSMSEEKPKPTKKCMELVRHKITVEAPPQKERITQLWSSMRLVSDNELSSVAESLQGTWRQVGKALNFKVPQLDRYEEENSGKTAADRMLFRWVQWRDQRATIGRLARVLFEEKAFLALDQLSP